MRFTLLVAVTALVALTAAAPVPAPKRPIASFEQLPKPLPLPYNERANAGQAVAAAKVRAQKAHKLLLIDLGGNWCLDCRPLAGTMEVAPLKRWLAQRFEIVTVDVGRFAKNLQIPARYGIKTRLAGVPAVLIVDPRTNRLINAGSVAPRPMPAA